MAGLQDRLQRLEDRLTPRAPAIVWLRASWRDDSEIVAIGGVPRLPNESFEAFRNRALAQLQRERPMGPLLAFADYADDGPQFFSRDHAKA